MTKKFAKPHRIVSNGSELIDAENDEGQHHGDGEVSHNPEVNFTTKLFYDN